MALCGSWGVGAPGRPPQCRSNEGPAACQDALRGRRRRVGVVGPPYVGGSRKMALCGSWGVGARRVGLPRRRAAERSEGHEFCSMQNIPCSAPSTGATQDRHGGRKGRLTAVTQVL